MRSDYPADLLRIKELLRNHPLGMSITEIADRLGRTKNTIGRYLDILRASGQVEVRTVGMAKIFSLARRIPVSHVISLLPSPAIVIDRNLRILHINQSFLEILGLPEQSVKNSTLASLEPESSEARMLLRCMMDAIGSGKKLDEIRLNRECGPVFRMKSLPLVFEDGTEGYAFGLIDITQEKRVEESLRRSVHLYRGMVEDLDLIVLTADAKGNITFINQLGRKVFGIRGFGDGRYPELRYLFSEIAGFPDIGELLDSSRMRSEDLIQFESSFIDDEKRQRWIRWTLKSQRDESGVVAGLICSGVDITEEHVKSEGLNRSERRYRELADLLPQPVFETDRNLRFTFGNRQAFIKFGYTMEDARRGLNILDMIAPEDRERAIENCSRLLRGEILTSRDIYMGLRKDGTRIPILEYSAPIFENGLVIGIRGIAIDLSEGSPSAEGFEREMFRRLLDGIPLPVIVSDDRGRLILANRVCQERLSAERLLTGGDLSRILGLKGEPFTEHEGECAARWVEGELQRPDGRLQVMRWHIYRMHDLRRRTIYILTWTD